jgi:hypothetical protein
MINKLEEQIFLNTNKKIELYEKDNNIKVDEIEFLSLPNEKIYVGLYKISNKSVITYMATNINLSYEGGLYLYTGRYLNRIPVESDLEYYKFLKISNRNSVFFIGNKMYVCNLNKSYLLVKLRLFKY